MAVEVNKILRLVFKHAGGVMGNVLGNAASLMLFVHGGKLGKQREDRKRIVKLALILGSRARYGLQERAVALFEDLVQKIGVKQVVFVEKKRVADARKVLLHICIHAVFFKDEDLFTLGGKACLRRLKIGKHRRLVGRNGEFFKKAFHCKSPLGYFLKRPNTSFTFSKLANEPG